MTNNYKIIQTKDPKIIKYLIPCIEKIIDKGRADYTVNDFLKWYMVNIGNPTCKTWIAIRKGNKFLKEDTELIGYIIGGIVLNLHEIYFNIIHIYSTNKKVSKDLQNVVEKWVKENGLHKIKAETKRNPKAWERAHGYKLLSYFIMKEV